MSKLLNKTEIIIDNKEFCIAVILLTTVFGGIYYFGILNAIYPDAETCIRVYQEWLAEITGRGTSAFSFRWDVLSSFYISDIAFKTAYTIGGCSFFTERLHETIYYAIELLLICLIVVFSSKKKITNVHLLPIVVILFVELHLYDINSTYGFSDTYLQSIINEYPPVYHSVPIISGLLSYLFVGILNKAPNKKLKIITIALLALTIIQSINYGDIIYFAFFLIPISISYFFKLINNSKYQKKMIVLAVMGCVALVLSKVLFTHSNIHGVIWGSGRADTYGNVYGAQNWTDNRRVIENISQLIFVVLGLFNIDRANQTFVSLWSLVLIIRFILLFCVLCATVKAIKHSFKCDNEQFDIIDYSCAYGVFIFAFLQVFCYGRTTPLPPRYFFSILVLSTILLVRNFEHIIRLITGINISDSIKKRILVLFLGCVFAIISMENVWSKPIIDSDAADIEKCIEYMEDNGGGYAIATFKMYARMGVQAKGRAYFFGSKNEHDQFFEEEKPRYVICNYDKDVSYVYQGYWSSLDELASVFGQPVEVVKFGNFWVHRLW